MSLTQKLIKYKHKFLRRALVTLINVFTFNINIKFTI